MYHDLHEFNSADLRRGYRMMVEQHADIIEDARTAALELGFNHRGVLVGATAVYFMPGVRKIYRVTAANHKIFHKETDVDFDDEEVAGIHEGENAIPLEGEKNCAEVQALLTVDHYHETQSDPGDEYPLDNKFPIDPDLFEGPKFLAGIFIASAMSRYDIRSIVTKDGERDIEVPATLPPCENPCRKIIASHPHSSSSTLLASVGLRADEPYMQIRSQSELGKLYSEGVDLAKQVAEITPYSTARSLKVYDQMTQTWDPRKANMRPAAFYSNAARVALMSNLSDKIFTED
jgi:hypothetical protein